jgi:hypothetical protein
VRAELGFGRLAVVVVLLRLGSPAAAHAQVYGQVGVGTGVSTVWDEAEARPALGIAVGFQTPGLATFRLEVRGVGNTDTALLSGGAAAGMTAPLSESAFGYILAAAGAGLYTEGQTAPHIGAIVGAGRRGRLPLFAEVRYDHFTVSMTSPPRGSHLLSLLGGVRVGARPERSR